MPVGRKALSKKARQGADEDAAAQKRAADFAEYQRSLQVFEQQGVVEARKERLANHRKEKADIVAAEAEERARLPAGASATDQVVYDSAQTSSEAVHKLVSTKPKRGAAKSKPRAPQPRRKPNPEQEEVIDAAPPPMRSTHVLRAEIARLEGLRGLSEAPGGAGRVGGSPTNKARKKQARSNLVREHDEDELARKIADLEMEIEVAAKVEREEAKRGRLQQVEEELKDNSSYDVYWANGAFHSGRPFAQGKPELNNPPEAMPGDESLARQDLLRNPTGYVGVMQQGGAGAIGKPRFEAWVMRDRQIHSIATFGTAVQAARAYRDYIAAQNSAEESASSELPEATADEASTADETSHDHPVYRVEQVTPELRSEPLEAVADRVVYGYWGLQRTLSRIDFVPSGPHDSLADCLHAMNEWLVEQRDGMARLTSVKTVDTLWPEPSLHIEASGGRPSAQAEHRVRLLRVSYQTQGQPKIERVIVGGELEESRGRSDRYVDGQGPDFAADGVVASRGHGLSCGARLAMLMDWALTLALPGLLAANAALLATMYMRR